MTAPEICDDHHPPNPAGPSGQQRRLSWRVIWNHHAGSASNHQSLLSDLSGRDAVTVHQSRSAQEARQLARDAAESSVDVLIAAGGDGTVNSVVQGILESGARTVLGILPLGTGNDFCRNLQIPLEPDRALRVLEQNFRRPVDVIRAETTSQTAYYINMATGGNTAQYSHAISEETKHFWGPLAYLRGAVQVLSALNTYRVAIAFDGEPAVTMDVLNVFLANGKLSGGGLMVAPDAEPDDGLLDAIVVKDCSPVDIAALAAQYALTDYRDHDSIIYRQARTVTLSSDPPLAITTDGNLLTDEPTRFTLMPRALQVVCPAIRV